MESDDELITIQDLEYLYPDELHGYVDYDSAAMYGYPSWYEDEPQDDDLFKVGVVRVPLILLRSIAALLEAFETLPRAWMLAIAEKFPETSLGELRSNYPSLLPPWLLQGYESYKIPALEARRNSLSVLTATPKCRFREGFASEGMLCNNPPIPLRVLDFLEHAEDLLNLALVCKATHEAGHFLLQREFPGGVGPGLVSHSDMIWTIERRKRSMLESALRNPLTTSTASGSTMAGGTEAKACAGTDAEGADYIREDILITLKTDECHTDEVDRCMLTLLRAKALAAAGPSVPKRPRPSHECLQRERGVAAEWRSLLKIGLADGIVLDTEAVGLAIAHWAEVNIKAPDQSSARAAPDAEHVMRMLLAAKQHGQGVIVHPECECDPNKRKYF